MMECFVQTLEKYEEIQNRPRVFGEKKEDEDKNASVKQESVDAKEKFKSLSFELIDIGLYTSQKGYELLQQTTPYQVTDQYLHVDEKVKQVKEHGIKLYRFINEKIDQLNPLLDNLYVIIDEAKAKFSFMMRVLQENQPKVVDYIQKQYENVQVIVSENWMRLDFNQDGVVTIDDLKKGAQELYEFMKTFDYFQKATEIKSQLYQEAIRYMKKDIEGASD